MEETRSIIKKLNYKGDEFPFIWSLLYILVKHVYMHNDSELYEILGTKCSIVGNRINALVNSNKQNLM